VILEDELRGLKVRHKRSNVDGVEPPERVKCWKREWCRQDGVRETAGASEVSARLKEDSRK